MTSVDALFDVLKDALTNQKIKKHTSSENGDIIVLSLVPTGIRRTKDGKQYFREESVQIDCSRSKIESADPEDLTSLQVISDKIKETLLGMHLTETIVLIQLENETGFAQNGNSQEYFWTGWFRVRLDLSNYA